MTSSTLGLSEHSDDPAVLRKIIDRYHSDLQQAALELVDVRGKLASVTAKLEQTLAAAAPKEHYSVPLSRRGPPGPRKKSSKHQSTITANHGLSTPPNSISSGSSSKRALTQDDYDDSSDDDNLADIMKRNLACRQARDAPSQSPQKRRRMVHTGAGKGESAPQVSPSASQKRRLVPEVLVSTLRPEARRKYETPSKTAVLTGRKLVRRACDGLGGEEEEGGARKEDKEKDDEKQKRQGRKPYDSDREDSPLTELTESRSSSPEQEEPRNAQDDMEVDPKVASGMSTRAQGQAISQQKVLIRRRSSSELSYLDLPTTQKTQERPANHSSSGGQGAASSSSQPQPENVPRSSDTGRPVQPSTNPSATAASTVQPQPALVVASPTTAHPQPIVQTAPLQHPGTQNSRVQAPTTSPANPSTTPSMGFTNLAQPKLEKFAGRPLRYRNLVIAGVSTRVPPPLITEQAVGERLDGCLLFQVILDENLRDVIVDRRQMSLMYGGSANTLATISDMDERFLYPKLDYNPHLPQNPGELGLLLTASPEAEWKGSRQKVFVCLRAKKYFYVGDYNLSRAKPISQEEYRTWPNQVKEKWAISVSSGGLKYRDIKIRILQRRQLGREPTQEEVAAAAKDKKYASNIETPEIIKAYEAGQETMFVWRMQCVDYDVDLLKEIVAERNKSEEKVRVDGALPVSPSDPSQPTASSSQ